MITTLPMRPADEISCPCRSFNVKLGNFDPISPAAITEGLESGAFAEWRHPASATRPSSNQHFLNIYSLLCTSRIVSFNGSVGSAFFSPAGF